MSDARSYTERLARAHAQEVIDWYADGCDGGYPVSGPNEDRMLRCLLATLDAERAKREEAEREARDACAMAALRAAAVVRAERAEAERDWLRDALGWLEKHTPDVDWDALGNVALTYGHSEGYLVDVEAPSLREAISAAMKGSTDDQD